MKTIKRIVEQQVQNNLQVVECANCWGYQEWAGRRSEISWKPAKGADGFILRFVKRYLKR